jgi:hypothetical protein
MIYIYFEIYFTFICIFDLKDDTFTYFMRYINYFKNFIMYLYLKNSKVFIFNFHFCLFLFLYEIIYFLDYYIYHGAGNIL